MFIFKNLSDVKVVISTIEIRNRVKLEKQEN